MIKLFSISVILLCTGCTNLGYYAQSINGQLGILSAREPIEELLQENTTDPQLKQKLSTVLKIRDFASQQLKLPENDSYRSYADTGKPYVVWNIVAAPEFSMELNKWCFLFAGCISYRGYFNEADAIEYAAEFNEHKNYDIYLRGVAAYSTLGWFDDPLLNTVIERNEASLAGLIFHELAHQVLYIDDDSAFNESFAKTVELEGVSLWMKQNNSENMADEYKLKASRRHDFINLVTSTSAKLEKLYTSGQNDSEKRKQKSEIITRMRASYQVLKQDWQGFDGYDNWFSSEINNAKIAAVTTYTDYVPAFTTLLKQQGYDFHKFYQAANQLGELPPKQREEKLARLNDLHTTQ